MEVSVVISIHVINNPGKLFHQWTQELDFLSFKSNSTSACLTSVKEEVAGKFLGWKSSDPLSSPNNHPICIKAHPSVGP